MSARGRLPEGWRWVLLREVSEINPRRPKELRRDDSRLTTFVPMDAVDGESGTITKPQERPFGEIRRGYTYFAEGDVLFAKITPCMQNGKHAIAEGLIDGIGFGTTEFHVIRPRPMVTSRWLHFYLRQPHVLKLAELSFTGSAGQQRVPIAFMSELELPLPPLPEQRRIVAKLAERLAAVARARAAARAQLDAARALPAAYLRAVFEGEEARGWPVYRLGDIAITTSGTTPSRGNEDYYQNGHVPWIKTGELVDGVIESAEEHVTPLALQETSLKLLPKGTLLVAMYGQGQTRGRTAILGIPATINQACFAVLPNPERYSPWFLQYWFRHNYLRLRQETENRGGNQPNLNGQILNSLEVPLPTVTIQERLVSALGDKLKDAKSVGEATMNQLQTIEQLPAAYLQQAFSGAL